MSDRLREGKGALEAHRRAQAPGKVTVRRIARTRYRD
jgi:hypothetical protein